MKALRRTGIPVLALGALLASCTEELSSEAVPGGGGGKTGESEVTLKLQVPQASVKGKTRAVDANAENAVDDLYILAFKVDPDDQSETFEYYVAAKQLKPTDGTGKSEWTASLQVREHEQAFVMIANAQGTTGKVNEQIAKLADDGQGGSSVGLYKMEVLETLTETLSEEEKKNGLAVTSTTTHHPFTMYGQTKPIRIGLNQNMNIDVALHRIMARVHVKFAGEAAVDDKFKAESVLLYNFNDQARVIPDNLGETTTGDYEKTATVPAGAKTLPETVNGNENVPTYRVENNEITYQIYMFEAAQPQLATDAENHPKRPCLIVKGVYEGKSYYYRVDFARQDAGGNTTYMDIIRNHSYNITVTNVSGRGSESAQEALRNKAANITANVIEWNDNTVGNIEFEGDKVLGIATKEYELMKAGGVRLQQVRATANLEWTAKLYDVNADGTANTNSQPDWINFTDKDGNVQGGGKSVTQQGTNALQDVYFKVDPDNPRPERKAIMRFTAGTLSVDALVVQNQKEIPVYLNVESVSLDGTGIEILQDGSLVLADIKFGPEDVTLSWGIVNGKDDGMDFKTVKMDNIDVSTDMKGEIMYDANKQNHYLEVETNALHSTKTWETRNAKLQLIALQKSTGEMVVREIPLFQKKYGLEIDKAEFVCGGQEVRIYVKGNMPWNASWSGQGFDDAVAAGLIPSSNDAGSGTPSETSWSSYISVRTKAKPLLSKDPYEMDLNFTHQNTSVTLDPKIVTIKGGVIEVGGKLYEVYGPVERSYNTKDTDYGDDPNTNIPGATIMTYAQGNALYDVDPSAVWGICKESEIVHCYTLTHSDGSRDYAPGAQIAQVIDISSFAGFSINEYVRMEEYGPDVPDAVLQSQLLLDGVLYEKVYDYSHGLLEGTISGELSITQLGQWERGQYGMTFRPYVKNVRWHLMETKEGTPMLLPANVYGAMSHCILNPFDLNIKESIEVKRSGATTELEVLPWKNKNYKTYYFKPAD